jgi:hypothetical protein
MNAKEYFIKKNLNIDSENIKITKEGFSWQYFDINGQYIAEKNIIFKNNNKKQYWSKQGLHNPPFNLQCISNIQNKQSFFICEGESDTETIKQNTDYMVIGISGWAGIPDKYEKLLRCKQWHLLNKIIWNKKILPICLFDRDVFYDKDKYRKSLKKAWFIKANVLNWYYLDRVTFNKYKDCKDINEIWCKCNNKEKFNSLLSNILYCCIDKP